MAPYQWKHDGSEPLVYPFNYYLTLSFIRRALGHIVFAAKPLGSWDGDQLEGLLNGPTGVAYLLWQISRAYPQLETHGSSVRYWAERYLGGARGELRLKPGVCGIRSEKLAHAAVSAVFTQDLSYVEAFKREIPQILLGDFPNDHLNGRAGTLYMMRMMRQ